MERLYSKNMTPCDEVIDDYETEQGTTALKIEVSWELWFNVEEFFGIKLSDRGWVNFYSIWRGYDDSIDVAIFISEPEEETQINYKLTPEESAWLREKMNQYSLNTTGKTIAQWAIDNALGLIGYSDDDLPKTVTVNINNLKYDPEENDVLIDCVSDYLCNEYGICPICFDIGTDEISGDITIDNIEWDTTK